MLGGRLEITSEVGHGSTFYFTARFPRTKKTVPPPVPRHAWIDLSGLPVLIVDDNATNRLILSEMLTNWRMRPTVTAGGEEALAAMRDAHAAGRPFQLILSDGQMPEMDGFMLAESVKGNPDLKQVPMILLTSAGRPGDGARCRKLGIAGFLNKPVKQSELLETISAVMGGGTATEAPGAEAIAPAVPSARPLRILLAEDNPVNQHVAARILEKRGHTVVVVHNGREAVEALSPDATAAFHVVLMDVQMPEMDGLAATAAIRARESASGGHIPIVAMTAHAMEGDRERCLRAGMDGYVTKPVEADRLIEAVESAAGRFDPHLAAQRLGGDRRLLRELLELFLADCPALVSNVRKAIDASDAAALRQAAHTLKGSVANFSAPRPFEAARRLERMGIDQDLSDADAAACELEEALNAFRAEARKETSR
jgi:CheY-like chemotaxis protein/HPt (histidine-containing phosphotransfer) domain-containing protein